MITRHQAKYFATELSRKHSVSDSGKIASALVDAQVDLNPHQVDAALFAFKSPLSKGAILADEVGLGKTIEAGLVLSQKWTEGKRRILVITPSSLRKQWVTEMSEKFYLPALILETKNYNQIKKQGNRQPFIQDTMVVCSYQFASRQYEDLMVIPWDLVVIDEAHRLRNVYKPNNKIGKTLKVALANSPKLLLTATPLQNSLMELYGLVSLIDDYAFGDAKSFRNQYARLTGEDTFDELKSRLKPICHRTLRRQVLEYIKYTNRIPLTQEFIPTPDEQDLYDMVSDYLRRPSLKALPASQRKLMILVMRKLLASSTFAIAGALDSLVRKLESQIKKNDSLMLQLEKEFSEDYEEFDEVSDEWDEESEEEKPLTTEDIEAIRLEIDDLKTFRDLAVSITENAKGLALISSLKAGFNKAKELGALEKTIIFTESRRTQEYLVRLLSKSGYEGKIVLFNGSNSDPHSTSVYKAWIEKHKNSDRITGSRSADIRQALVDYFRESAQIMIATEAAAEGINLQFCSMVVNYDLPWNPQRIEQRIGRAHRYGQKHDVVVINFLNKNNAADQRVYELLSEKFQLFSGVFGASDEVLGVIESGVDFEKRIVDIYQNCRTPEEIESEFSKLRSEMDAQISVTMESTRKKLLENFDAEVHDRLKVNLKESREYIDKFENLLWLLTKFSIERNASFIDSDFSFDLTSAPGSLDIPTGKYKLGREANGFHRYRLGHPLAQRLIKDASSQELPEIELILDYSGWGKKSTVLENLKGKTGTLLGKLISITGSDAQDHIFFSGQTDDGINVPDDQIKRMLLLSAKEGSQVSIDSKKLIKEIDKQKKKLVDEITQKQSEWFDEEMGKLDHWSSDRRNALKVDLKEMDEALLDLKKQIRSVSNLPEKIALQRKVKTMEFKRDQAWKDYDNSAKEIETQKDRLLDEIESKLQQEVSESILFSARWIVR